MSTLEENIEAVELVLAHGGSNLSTWHLQFLESIDQQLTEGRILTPKQEGILDELFRKMVG